MKKGVVLGSSVMKHNVEVWSSSVPDTYQWVGIMS